MGTRNTKKTAATKSNKKTKRTRAKTKTAKEATKVMFIYAKNGNADFVKSIAKKSNSSMSSVINSLIATLRRGKARITDNSKAA